MTTTPAAVFGEAFWSGRPETNFAAGSKILTQGERTGRLIVLTSGEALVERDGTPIAVVSEPGSILGEMSLLLDAPHAATVTALCDCRAVVIENGGAVIKSDQRAILAVTKLLARRLDALTGYLADLKKQYAGDDDHVAMVHDVLGCLCQHQSRPFEAGSDRERV